jgi:ketosteroid isomerase-like protein
VRDRNAEVVRGMVDAFRRGDRQRMREHFAADGRLVVDPPVALPGVWRGFEGLAERLDRLTAELGGEPRLEVDDVMPGERHVALRYRLCRADGTGCHERLALFRVHRGRVAEIMVNPLATGTARSE